MGLFGPSYTWEEIQRKNDILGELKRENDRVIDEQRRMLNETGYGSGGADDGTIVMLLLVPFILGIAFICCLPLLISQLSLLDEGDPIAVEVLVWFISSFLTWIIFSIKKPTNQLYEKMVATNFILVMIGLIGVDVIFFDALDHVFTFILGLILSCICMVVWSGIASGLGMIVVKSIQKIKIFLKIEQKKKLIANSKLYPKLLSKVEAETREIEVTDSQIIFSNNKSATINYNDEGYSNLDYIGMIALGQLIKKEHSNFYIKKNDNSVLLVNKKIEKEEQVRQKSEAKQNKENLKKQKQMEKEKIKKGEDW